MTPGWLALGAGVGVGVGWAFARFLRLAVDTTAERGRAGLLFGTAPLRVLLVSLAALWLASLHPSALLGGMAAFWVSSRILVRKLGRGGAF